MQIHELTFAMQQDRERDLRRTLAARRHLTAGGRVASRGITARLRGLAGRHAAPAAPVVQARSDPTRV